MTVTAPTPRVLAVASRRERRSRVGDRRLLRRLVAEESAPVETRDWRHLSLRSLNSCKEGFELPAGVTLLVGENGSATSSLVESALWRRAGCRGQDPRRAGRELRVHRREFSGDPQGDLSGPWGSKGADGRVQPIRACLSPSGSGVPTEA